MDGSKSQEQNSCIVGDERKPIWSIRLAIVCFAAAAIGLPIALISIAKFALFISGLIYLLTIKKYNRSNRSIVDGRCINFILIAVFCFLLSVIWSAADVSDGLIATVKHSKLLLIPLIVVLVRDKREARLALIFFITFQAIGVIISWLLFFDVSVAGIENTNRRNAAFSTYLDQSIMAATSAGIIWHLRNQIAWPVWASWALTAIFLGATVFVFQGRTGYIVSGAVMSIAFYWMTPDRYRRVILLLAPIFVGTAMLSVSPPFQKRTANLVYEVTNYFQYLQGKEEIVWSGTSSGWRLNAWKVSIESIANSPVRGYGVGSWAMVARNTHGIGADQVFGKSNASNPHQEYLLWGVELGVLGLLLLPTIFLALIQDAKLYPSPIKLAVTSTVFALAIACMFNSVLYDDLIGDYFCIVIGLLMAYGKQSFADREYA